MSDGHNQDIGALKTSVDFLRDFGGWGDTYDGHRRSLEGASRGLQEGFGR